MRQVSLLALGTWGRARHTETPVVMELAFQWARRIITGPGRALSVEERETTARGEEGCVGGRPGKTSLEGCEGASPGHVWGQRGRGAGAHRRA